MSNVVSFRKGDAEAAKNQEDAIKVLENVIESIRTNKCNGMMIVAFERDTSGPEVEMSVRRYYISGGIGDMLTLMGINKIVMDEMSEGSRITMGME